MFLTGGLPAHEVLPQGRTCAWEGGRLHRLWGTLAEKEAGNIKKSRGFSRVTVYLVALVLCTEFAPGCRGLRLLEEAVLYRAKIPANERLKQG